MDTAISLISDLIILVFNLSLYIKLTPLKKETKLYKGMAYGFPCLITALYMVAVYVFHAPYAAASFICMTVPSFLFFLSICKYKNSRFLVTFCFVDTVTFIIAAVSKVTLIIGSNLSGLISCIVMLILCLITYFAISPYCAMYRDLLARVSRGWAPMAVSTVFIYLLLIGFTSYPKPMIDRLEYLPLFFLICVTVLSFYAVFIILILQKAQLTRANQLLQQQQHWHDLAYLDQLTQLANQGAYASRVEEIQQETVHDKDYFLLIFDIDDFKHVNDTYGHMIGNKVLQKTAELFLKTFPASHFEFFRIGGDEFAAIASGLTAQEAERAGNRISTMKLPQEPGCTYSCGWAAVDFSQEKPFEKAFVKADEAMYAVKSRKKAKA